jgi:hypothetical protein
MRDVHLLPGTRKGADMEKVDVDRYGGMVEIARVGNVILNPHLVEYGYVWVFDR